MSHAHVTAGLRLSEKITVAAKRILTKGRICIINDITCEKVGIYSSPSVTFVSFNKIKRTLSETPNLVSNQIDGYAASIIKVGHQKVLNHPTILRNASGRILTIIIPKKIANGAAKSNYNSCYKQYQGYNHRRYLLQLC